ncbi:unnamed protein product [Dovyalis caffra]|uniref:Uncharacterized protein n=1 Tax=Dovyalis caffra TaxID=77055 RepID=A0AAV1SK60_9ROSI|nr:unnamed protein product [Dovyalis caffra]
MGNIDHSPRKMLAAWLQSPASAFDHSISSNILGFSLERTGQTGQDKELANPACNDLNSDNMPQRAQGRIIVLHE